MGPLGQILPTKFELFVCLFAIGFTGWAVIEAILWLFSLFTITFTGVNG